MAVQDRYNTAVRLKIEFNHLAMMIQKVISKNKIRGVFMNRRLVNAPYGKKKQKGINKKKGRTIEIVHPLFIV